MDLSIFERYVFYAREMIYWLSPNFVQCICLYITKQIEAILSETSSAAMMATSMQNKARILFRIFIWYLWV